MRNIIGVLFGVTDMATRLAKLEVPVNSKDVQCIEFEESYSRSLSARDSNELRNLLLSEAEPTDAAVQAFKRYKDSAIECKIQD